MRRFTETINKGSKYEDERPIKGLVLVHLFNKVWRIGKLKIVGDRFHSIIYSPDDKEYHVWDNDVISFYPKYENDESDYERHHNKPDPAKVKIYILTHILDEKENWCFDTNALPEVGKSVKVIFENGTIKWIGSFSGDWKNHRMETPGVKMLGMNPEWERSLGKIIRDKNGKLIQHDQFLWEPAINYKKIVAWKVK